MPTHRFHHDKDCYYFVTFTCYDWLPMIEKTNLYNYLDGWVKQINRKGIQVCGYVFMPNHIHLLVYVHNESKGLNHVIGEGKRFMSYEIIKRLKSQNEHGILKILKKGVAENDIKKGQQFRVFRHSFDAKKVTDIKEINKVLDYIHHNPCTGKWHLAADFVSFSHSSAAFYEEGTPSNIEILHFENFC